MSEWTGKCDFADHCDMIYKPEEIVKNSEVFMGNARILIRDTHDLIPYYTNLISMMSASNGHQSIHLSQNSYIDDDEADRLSYRIYAIIKVARKIKKLKRPLFFNDLPEDVFAFYDDDDIPVLKAIIDIINSEPSIIKEHLPSDYRESLRKIQMYLIPKYFNGIHLKYSNLKRENFVKFAQKNGFGIFESINGVLVSAEGEFHPLIHKMCYSIYEYQKMIKKYNI